jgi:hypothetical protein
MRITGNDNVNILLTPPQDFVVDGGMTKAYVTPEGPPLAGPKKNALLSEQVDAIRGTGVPDA